MTAPSSPAPAAPAPPSTIEMIDAIKAVKLAQAGKIGALCVANVKSGAALDLAALAAETEILAGLDLAVETLVAGL